MMYKLFVIFTFLLITGCASSIETMNHKSGEVKFTGNKDTFAVYIISPKGYFAPYEYYLVKSKNINVKVPFGHFKCVLLSNFEDVLNINYSFKTEAKFGYDSNVFSPKQIDRRFPKQEVRTYYLLRDKGTFNWVSQAQASKAVKGLVYSEEGSSCKNWAQSKASSE